MVSVLNSVLSPLSLEYPLEARNSFALQDLVEKDFDLRKPRKSRNDWVLNCVVNIVEQRETKKIKRIPGYIELPYQTTQFNYQWAIQNFRMQGDRYV